MSKKANPTLIGAFVVGAAALLALGVSVFGGAELFARKSEWAAYFPESVKGLRVGSNVLFRGVKIGFVSEISLLGDPKTLETVVRTKLELQPGTWQFVENGKRLSEDAIEIMESDLQEAGLRAQLGIESLVTGQLVVELDLLPDTVAVYRARLSQDKNREIPTVPSNTQKIIGDVQEFIGKLDVDKLIQNLQGSLEGLDQLANSKDLRDSLAGMNRLINSRETQELSASANAALREAKDAARDFRALVDNVDGRVEPILEDLKPTVARLDAALAAVETTLDSVNRQLGGDTSLDWNVSSTLREVRDAARALRNFVDYLDQHPEALIRGKREQ